MQTREHLDRLAGMEHYLTQELQPYIRHLHSRIDTLEKDPEKVEPPEPERGQRYLYERQDDYSRYPVRPIPPPPPEQMPQEGYGRPPPPQERPLTLDDRETVSLEVEFGSKWLQYIGILVIVTTFILLGVYTIQYMTPLQENMLIYASALILLGFGEYLFRTRETKAYGKGLVFGGFLVAYISVWSSFYSYGVVELSGFLLILALIAIANLALGFRYGSNLLITQGFIATFLLIFTARYEVFIGPLTYGLLIPTVTVLGCVIAHLRRDSEYYLLFISLPFIWLMFTSLYVAQYVLFPLFLVTAIVIALVIIRRRVEEESSPVIIDDVQFKFPIYMLPMSLAYITLVTTTFLTGIREIDYLLEYDPWFFLIFLFILQMFFKHWFEPGNDDYIPTITLTLTLVIIGILTLNVDSIYIYLALSFLIPLLNFNRVFKGEGLTSHCLAILLVLIMGRLMIYQMEVDTTSALNYFYESLLIFYILMFGILNLRFRSDWIELEGSNQPICTILAPLAILYFASQPDLSYAFFIIPILLFIFAYLGEDILSFNGAYLMVVYSIYHTLAFDGERYPEIFILSSVLLFMISLVLEATNRKKNLAIGTAVFSSILLITSTYLTYVDNVETTLIWMVFGITSISIGLYLNTYYLRWIGLFTIIISIGKAYAVDIAVLSLELKIFSFAILGFILLIISYTYTRYKSKILRTFGLEDQRARPPPPPVPPPPPLEP